MKLSPKLFGWILLSSLFFSCQEHKLALYSETPTDVNLNISKQQHKGKALLENKCYVCHSPSASHDERLGPPMAAVKAHYIGPQTTKKEFINELWAFVQKPDSSKSKMRGAVRRFGLMPYQQFKQKEIELIADYLYDNQIEEPAWFKEHWQERGKGKGKGNQQKGRK